MRNLKIWSLALVAFVLPLLAFGDVSKSGYKLVFSSETPAAAKVAMPNLTDEELAACTGCFENYEALEKVWDYCSRESPTWKRLMGTTLAEQRQMVDFTDGVLNLHAKKVTSASDGTEKFLTSGLQMKQGYTYGIIEIKAKNNPFTGNFPALWMMPVDNSAGWPYGGEIDIMEMIDNSYRVYGTVHNGNCTCIGKAGYYSGNTMASEGYHVYTLLWTTNSLTWYCDGNQFYQLSKPTSNADVIYPFDKDFYIIVNQSVGNGSWAANVDESHAYEQDIEYVRIYQPTNDISLDTSTYYTIQCGYSGWPRYAVGEGTSVVPKLTTLTSGDNARWQFLRQTDGTFLIRNKGTGLYATTGAEVQEGPVSLSSEPYYWTIKPNASDPSLMQIFTKEGNLCWYTNPSAWSTVILQPKEYGASIWNFNAISDDKPSFSRGDVNRDGKVDIADITELAEILLGRLKE